MNFNYNFELPEITNLEELKAAIDTGWPWPLSAVQSFFEDLVNKILGVASKVWDLIPAAIKDPITNLSKFLSAATRAFLDFMSDPLGKIKSILGYIWDIIPDSVKKPLTALATFLGQLTTATMDFLKDPLGKIKSILGYIWDIMPAAIKDSLKAVANFAAGITSAFLDFIKDPIGKIKAALDYVWSITPDWLKSPINFIANLAGQVGSALINFFKDPVGSLKELARKVWELLPDWLRGIFTALGQFVGSISAAFLDFLRDPVGKISGALSWIIDKISPVVDSIKSAGETLAGIVKQPLEQMAAGISDILQGKALTWFDGAVASLAGGVEQYVFKPIGDFLNKYVVEPLKELPKTILDFLGYAAGSLGSIINEKVIPAISGAFNWIVDQVKGLFTSFYDGIQKFIEKTSLTTPEDWPKAVAELATLSLGIGLALSVAQTKIVACGLDLGPISDILNKVMDPNILLNPIIAGFIGAGFGVALKRYLNRKYLNWIPDPKTAYDEMRKGIITYDKAAMIATDHGISREEWNNLVELWDYDPAVSDLYTWSNYVEITDDIITKVFKSNRIPTEWQTPMRQIIKLRPLRNEIAALINKIVDLRDSGYITEDVFNSKISEMKAAGYIKGTEAALREDQAELGFNKTILALRIDTLKYQFRKGKITADQLEEGLIQLGCDPLLANAIKENELARAGLLEAG